MVPTSGAPGSPAQTTGSHMSAVCDGLQSLGYELQHFQTGFEQLVIKVKTLQQVAAKVDQRDSQIEYVDVDGSEGEAPLGLPEVLPPREAQGNGDTAREDKEANGNVLVATGNSGSPLASQTLASGSPLASQTLDASSTNSGTGKRSPEYAPTTDGHSASPSRAESRSTRSVLRIAMRDPGRLKLMTCWTALQTLHEENAHSKDTSTLSALKQANKDSVTAQKSEKSEVAGAAIVRSTSIKEVAQDFRSSLRSSFHHLQGILAPKESESRPWPCSKAWQPQSNVRLLWDFIGLVLLCYDTIVIPVELSWDLATEGLRYNIAIIALAYWSADFMTNFNTGYYHAGKLITKRWRVAFHYLRTWLLPDAFLVSLDYILLTSSQDSGSLRSSRFIRIMRLVRLIKMSKTTALIDSVAVATGCTAEAMIILPLLKTLIFILVGVHMMSCGWFWTGRAAMAAGDPNWLVSSGIYVLDMGSQYVHSFRWVLCQFTPAPNAVNPQNVSESVYCIVTILLSMVTMGASLARISAAVQQLNAMKFAKIRRLREIRLYLLDQNVSPELSNRILTFADYSLQHAKEGISMDFSLVSVKLRQELMMHRSGDNLRTHPLMDLVHKAFPDVFMRLCESLSERVYEQGETVFRAGSQAHFMYVITNGDFSLHLPSTSGDQATEIKASSREWFTDVALFSNVIHVETLQSRKFGKVCNIEGSKFAQLLQSSPPCSELVLDYATRYLQALRGDLTLTSDCLRERAQEACENTQAYQWCTGKLSLRPTDYGQPYRTEGDFGEVPEFLSQVLEQSLPVEDAVPMLIETFPELQRSETCVYTRFRADVERYRAGASILSILSLLCNRYDLFTAPQDDENRIGNELWDELRLFIQWAGLSAKAIHSVIVFLAVRGAGKVKSLVDQLPLHPTESPESIVLYMMEQLSSLLPSSEVLDEDSYDLLAFIFEAGREFNIAQFMQGENLPFNIARLQEFAQSHPPHYYPSYLLSFIGVMCGIAGSPHWESDFGSRFMTQKNALTIVEVLRALKKLNDETPQDLYWGYMETRACRLAVPAPISRNDPAYLILARLLCTYRANDFDGRRLVESSLETLDLTDKRLLMHHLLADGFAEHPTYVLAFLPACLANAQANTAVGLSRCLAKLAEIYGMLDARRCLDMAGGINVKVDLSEFSKFIAQVKSATVFNQCVEFMKIRGLSDSLSLSMSTKNWSRVYDDDASEFSAYQSLRQLLHQQEMIKEVLKQLASQRGAAATHHPSPSRAVGDAYVISV